MEKWKEMVKEQQRALEAKKQQINPNSTTAQFMKKAPLNPPNAPQSFNG
jgi:hypothetical protein